MVTQIYGQPYSHVPLDTYCQIPKSNLLQATILKLRIYKFHICLSVFILLLLFVLFYVLSLKISIKMDDEGFYVHLPSNVKRSNPDQVSNSIGNYITHLAKKLNLTDDWECALTEISYTKSWHNILIDEPIDVIDIDGNVISTNMSLNTGSYKSINEILRVINAIYLDGMPVGLNEPPHNYIHLIRPIVLSFNPISHKINISIGIIEEKDANDFIVSKKLILPKFSKYLNNLLGLVDNQDRELSFANRPSNYTLSVEYADEFNKIDIDGFKEIQIDAAIHSLFVYTNIIHPILVGDSFSQLLRQVEIPDKKEFGNQCVIKYQSLYYIPLLYKEIDAIEIDIRDDTNKPIEFAFGRTIVTLHFRKRIKNGIQSIYELLR